MGYRFCGLFFSAPLWGSTVLGAQARRGKRTRGGGAATNPGPAAADSERDGGTKRCGGACAERYQVGGVAYRPRPVRGRRRAVTSRRSCHGRAEWPRIGAGVVQGPGPPGEAGKVRPTRGGVAQNPPSQRPCPPAGDVLVVSANPVWQGICTTEQILPYH